MSVSLDSLNWIKDELELLLATARQRLDTFAEEPQEKALLEEYAQLLHQVSGALTVAGVEGGQLLAGAMENLAHSILNGEHAPDRQSLEPLMRASIEISEYLEKLASGLRDSPAMVLERVNELRACDGLQALDYEQTASSHPSRPQLVPQGNGENVVQLAKRLHRHFQTGLLSYLRREQPGRGLGVMRGVISRLEKALTLPAGFELFWVANGYLEAIEKGNSAHGDSDRRLLAQLEREIKRLSHGESEDSFIEGIPSELEENLLSEIADSVSTGERIEAIRSNFQLQRSTGRDVGTNSLESGGPSLVRSVGGAILEDLAQVRDRIDIFVRARSEDSGELMPLVATLKKVGDALGMLGVSDIEANVAGARQKLSDFAEAESVPERSDLLALATWLIRIESDVEAHLRGSTEDPSSSALRAARSASLREILADMSGIRDTISEQLGETGLVERFANLPAVAEHLAKTLELMSFPAASGLMHQLSAYLSKILNSGTLPEKMSLDRMADAIVSLEYYLETLQRGRDGPESMLDNAYRALAALGADDSVGAEKASSNLSQDTRSVNDTSGITASEEGPGKLDLQSAGHKTKSAASSGSEAKSLPPIREDGADPEIIEVFMEEAADVGNELNEHYPIWCKNFDDENELTIIRRAFHTLKGSGRLVGAKRLGEFAWAYENLLNRVLDHTVKVDKTLVDTVGEAISMLPHMVEQFASGEEGDVDPRPSMEHAWALARSDRLGQQTGGIDTEEDEVTSAENDSSGPQGNLESNEPQPRIELTLYKIFRNETAQHLQVLTSWVESVEDGKATSITGSLRRAAHTLSGSASMAGVSEVYSIASELVQCLQLAEEANTNANRCLFAVRRVINSVDELVKSYGDDSRELPSIQGTMSELGRLLESLRQEVELRAPEAEAPEAEAPEAEAPEAEAPEEEAPEEEAPEEEAPEEEAPEEEAPEEEVPEEEVPEEEVPEEEVPEEEVPEEEVPEEEVRDVIAPISIRDPRREVVNLKEQQDYDPELAQVFLAEAGELLDGADASLQAWVKNHDLVEPLIDLQRRLHTLKGGARMAGVAPIANLAHELESMLSRVADGRLAVSIDVLRLIERTFDRIHRMREYANSTGQVPFDRTIVANLRQQSTSLVETLIEEDQERVRAMVSEGAQEELPDAEDASTDTGENTDERHWISPAAEASVVPQDGRREIRVRHALARVRSDLLEGAINNAGEVSIFRGRIEQRLVNMQLHLGELERTVERVRHQLRELELETEAQVLTNYESPPSRDESEFDPLEFDRYTRIHELSRSLAEAVSDLTSLKSLFATDLRQSAMLLERQGRVNGDLQDALLRTRMVPFSLSSARLNRVVRQVSDEVGKPVQLSLHGIERELDREVLEHILPAIEHLLRNAVVHGIEPLDQRKARSKPDAGRIQLSLSREGSDLIIEVSDDGLGLDLVAIRARAEQRGLLQADTSLSDRKIAELIFAPGFSTADSLTLNAGRGVGMDVVASEVRRLGGQVELDWKAFTGTRVRLRLPVTLAITQTLLTRVGHRRYPIPLSGISGVVRVLRHELNALLESENPMYRYGGFAHEIVSLADVLAEDVLGPEEETAKVPLLFAKSGKRRIAFIADDMLGNREVVVKPVGAQVSSVPGIAGATIFGDGSIGLLLDLNALVRSIPEGDADVPRPAPSRATAPSDPLVLVVDDSITVRRVTQRLLERRGVRVLTAKDGVEALELLQDHVPDLALLDIEMPRMDGYELAGHMKNDPRLRKIPIVVITSRTGEKHRTRAEKIGVANYLGKPYQETQLIEAMQQILGNRISVEPAQETAI